MYEFSYSVPSVDGYKFLFAIPYIGWTDSLTSFEAIFKTMLLTSQNGKCEIIVNGTIPKFVPIFSAFYYKT